ncbi:MAG: DUF427 domain-containing protein [Sporichthyaceae bacterium]
MGIEVVESTRQVRIELDGVVLAESKDARILSEGRLRPRYYLPEADVRMDLLTPSDTSSRCPYKGAAEYWSVAVGGNVHPDVAWTYRSPIPERADIAGLICFYDEKVDLYLDGELQP